MDSLGHCRTIRDIKRALEELPPGLNQTYGRILADIPQSEAPIVRKILTWLSFSAASVSLGQLWEALAIERGGDRIDDEYRLRSAEDILTLGKSLITLTADGHVTLTHLSVRDYIVSGDIEQSPETARFALKPGAGHLELAQDCLTYLFFSDLRSGPCNSRKEYMSRLRRFPLLTYTAKYWFYHSRIAEDNVDLWNQTLRFFSHEARKIFMSWVQVLNAADAPFKWNVFPRHATSLYYASSLGLDGVVDWLLQSAAPDEINAAGSRFGGTALHAATIRGHLNIAKQLIAQGADPGKPDFNGVTPLHSAASQGSADLVRVLLAHGAPADAKDSMDGKSPAEWAECSGHKATAGIINHVLQDPDLRQDSMTLSEGGCGTPSQKTEIWRPVQGYFPDYYEKRSGLDSPLIISMTVGEICSYFDSEFRPLVPLGGPDRSLPVW